MTAEEIDLLADMKIEPILIDATQLKDRSDRTLLFGYTKTRQDFHVYIRGGEIQLRIYGLGYWMDDNFSFHDVEPFEPETLVPDKRLYPECCDFEFCCLLRKMGQPLPFTTFNPDRTSAQYYGAIV